MDDESTEMIITIIYTNSEESQEISDIELKNKSKHTGTVNSSHLNNDWKRLVIIISSVQWGICGGGSKDWM